MRFYILDTDAAGHLTGKSATGELTESALRRAARHCYQNDRLDYVAVGYLGILEEFDIDADEWMEHPLAEALNGATEGECEWFALGPQDAASLLSRLRRVTITEEEITPYFDALRWSDDVNADVNAAHRLFQQALDAAGECGTTVLRVRD